jgi:hypothetical protein
MLVGVPRPGRRGWTVAAMVVAASAGSAHADGDRALSVGLAFATFSAPAPRPRPSGTPPTLSPDGGGALTLTYEHAVSTDLSLRGELDGGVFYGGNERKESPMSYAGLIDVDIVYRFDVLAYVPYAFAGVGGVYATGGPIDTSPQAVVVIGGGLDWLQSRDRSYGVEVKLASFAGDITVFTIGLRGSVRWGYF